MGATSIAWCIRYRPDGSAIPGYTFNPWWGCQKVSEACRSCYAEAFAKRTGHKVWGGERSPRRFFGDKHWSDPEKWNAKAQAVGERSFVFCASMADVFEDRDDLEPHRLRLWHLIERTPWLDWLLLTKRPENQEMVPLKWITGSHRPPNVSLGITAETQGDFNRRAPDLVAAAWPAHRFVSMEPMLEDIEPGAYLASIDQIIVGGESNAGKRTRAMLLAWARAQRDRCRRAGKAYFFKQIGSRPSDPEALALLGKQSKGESLEEIPFDLRIRMFPGDQWKTMPAATQ